MSVSTISALLLATPFATSLWALTVKLVPLIVSLGGFLHAYRNGPITPESTYQFETGVQERLRDIGRVIV